MPLLIAYDIEDDTLRGRVANRILADGFLRLQKSVFAGDPREPVLRALETWLKKQVPGQPGSTDSVLLLSCTQNQLESATLLGQAPADWAALLHPPNTLII